jgi:small subunit ribosomal protein S17
MKMTKKSKIETKNIGIEVKKPENVPKLMDSKDPFFGSVKLRGRVFVGTVISDKMQKTATIEWPRRKYNKKYERFEVRRTRVKAHNPESINAKTGDLVKIAETRPLSKTKNFVVIEIVKRHEV